ncbi:MAG: glycosyltransferase family 9 protein [Chlorobiaceae bacterium]|nr:glycosyltransferase family 9 protein [Chlorobiaceae bacterium]
MLKSLKKKWAIYGSGYYHVLRYSRQVHNKKLLIVHFDHLGDVCTLIPAIYPLVKKYDITVSCKSGLEGVWREFLPMVKVVPLKSSEWSATRVIEQQGELFAAEYEAVIIATIAPYSAFYSSLITAGKRVGLIEGGRYYKGARLLYDKVYDAQLDEHVRYRYPALLSIITGEFSPYEKPPYVSTPQPTKTLLIHPGGKWKPRRWPIDRYMSVAQEVVEKYGFQCQFLVHESEADLRAYVERYVNGKDLLLRLTRNVSELVQAVKDCYVFLGNDSGPVHLANLMNKESVVLWGPGNYNRIHPYGENNEIIIRDIDCRPCRQYQNDEYCQRGENICLLSISVEEVFAAVGRKIEKIWQD